MHVPLGQEDIDPSIFAINPLLVTAKLTEGGNAAVETLNVPLTLPMVRVALVIVE